MQCPKYLSSKPFNLPSSLQCRYILPLEPNVLPFCLTTQICHSEMHLHLFPHLFSTCFPRIQACVCVNRGGSDPEACVCPCLSYKTHLHPLTLRHILHLLTHRRCISIQCLRFSPSRHREINRFTTCSLVASSL